MWRMAVRLVPFGTDSGERPYSSLAGREERECCAIVGSAREGGSKSAEGTYVGFQHTVQRFNKVKCAVEPRLVELGARVISIQATAGRKLVCDVRMREEVQILVASTGGGTVRNDTFKLHIS
jgi:hypothetical protein